MKAAEYLLNIISEYSKPLNVYSNVQEFPVYVKEYFKQKLINIVTWKLSIRMFFENCKWILKFIFTIDNIYFSKCVAIKLQWYLSYYKYSTKNNPFLQRDIYKPLCCHIHLQYVQLKIKEIIQ